MDENKRYYLGGPPGRRAVKYVESFFESAGIPQAQFITSTNNPDIPFSNQYVVSSYSDELWDPTTCVVLPTFDFPLVVDIGIDGALAYGAANTTWQPGDPRSVLTVIVKSLEVIKNIKNGRIITGRHAVSALLDSKQQNIFSFR